MFVHRNPSEPVPNASTGHLPYSTVTGVLIFFVSFKGAVRR